MTALRGIASLSFMLRIFWILPITCAALLLAGCDTPAPKQAPIWQQVKIGDLAPRVTAEPNQQLSDNINVDIYIFEIPTSDANVLSDIWPLLYTMTLRFNDYDAFGANLFAAGFGEAQMWDSAGSILRTAGARMVERNSIVLLDGKTRDLTVTSLDSEKAILYASAAGRSEGVTIGPGSLCLRIRAVKIPSRKGVCEMDIQPAFLPLSSRRSARSEEARKTLPFTFEALAFGVKMSPGNFFLLGPKQYTTEKTSLAGLFFCQPHTIPSARLYMFVCGGIAD